jgi:hypothetical protein
MLYRRVVMAGALGLAAALVLVAGQPFFTTSPPAEPVATIEHIDGADPAGSRGRIVHTGEWIDTGSHTRTNLRFTDGTSVRLDTASRVFIISSSVIELAAGAVYVDSGQPHSRFEIRTAFATAHDIGTQFELRLIDDRLRLRVRTGVVELRDRARLIAARPGTEITWSAVGAVSRPIEVHGPEWDWTSRAAAPAEMEGETLARFLDHVAREQGWTVAYADSSIARDAQAIVLHGSVLGLTAEQAIEVAIVSSGLQHQLESGALHVFRETPLGPHKHGVVR